MIPKLLKKRTRHHPAVQDRRMKADGFTEFSELAFDDRLEKSAAPLSKRRYTSMMGIGNLPITEGDFTLAEGIALAITAYCFYQIID